MAGNNQIQGVIINNSPNDSFVDETVGITVAGSVWELQGANTYTGPTLVQTGGTLLVTGAGSIAAGSTVTVDLGGTLGGDGTINGTTTISDTPSPGNSPGVQSFGGDLSYTAESNVTWELINDVIGVRGTDFDGIDVGGNLDFTGASTLTLDFTTPGGVDWTDTFWDSDYTGTSGWLVYSVTGTLSNFSNLSLIAEILTDHCKALPPSCPLVVSLSIKLAITSI